MLIPKCAVIIKTVQSTCPYHHQISNLLWNNLNSRDSVFVGCLSVSLGGNFMDMVSVHGKLIILYISLWFEFNI